MGGVLWGDGWGWSLEGVLWGDGWGWSLEGVLWGDGWGWPLEGVPWGDGPWSTIRDNMTPHQCSCGEDIVVSLDEWFSW